MAAENTSWQLEDFVDSLVVELDKTRETLAVKAINKPLSYTVKEMALDLNIFPSYDGDQVTFITAQPGQQGASKVTIQLGSITDQQVRATTKVPGGKNEISLGDMDVDKKTRKQLRKLGVNSADDLKQLERKNVDVGKVSDSAIDYRKLAGQIEKSKRSRNPPRVDAAVLSVGEDQVPYLLIQGDNLAIDPRFQPVAVVNERLAEVMSCDEHELKIQITADHNLSADNEVILTVDPFAVLKINVKAGPDTI
jgi:hypothetical protein